MTEEKVQLEAVIDHCKAVMDQWTIAQQHKNYMKWILYLDVFVW